MLLMLLLLVLLLLLQSAVVLLLSRVLGVLAQQGTAMAVGHPSGPLTSHCQR
jgi:hypothetical protein